MLFNRQCKFYPCLLCILDNFTEVAPLENPNILQRGPVKNVKAYLLTYWHSGLYLFPHHINFYSWHSEDFTENNFLPLCVSAVQSVSPVRRWRISRPQSQVSCRPWTVTASPCVSPASSTAPPPGGPGTPASAATSTATLNTCSLETRLTFVLSSCQRWQKYTRPLLK